MRTKIIDIIEELLRAGKRNLIFVIFLTLQITAYFSKETSAQIWEQYIAPFLDDNVLKFVCTLTLVGGIFATIWTLLRIGKGLLLDENIGELTELGLDILCWLSLCRYIFCSLCHFPPFSYEFLFELLCSPQAIGFVICFFLVVTPVSIQDIINKQKNKKDDHDSF